jgi:hypothetical protein
MDYSVVFNNNAFVMIALFQKKQGDWFINMKSKEELKILYSMIMALPDKMSVPILEQFNKTMQALENERLGLRDNILKELRDLQLDMSYMDFDLHATKQERDKYKQQLNEMDDSDGE